MYGGHIVNDFDRLMSSEYLNFIMKDELLDETEMYPFNEGEKESFKCPPPTTQDRSIAHINENMGADTPIAFAPSSVVQYGDVYLLAIAARSSGRAMLIE